MLFRSGNYSKHGRNPLQIHGLLNGKSPLLPEHFQRWLEIFDRTVDSTFAGPRADFIKMRAQMIAGRMVEFVNNLNFAFGAN
jgi:hemoglobin